MSISLAGYIHRGSEFMEEGITRAKQLSKQVQHEYSVSSRLIDEQTTVTVCGKGDGELTRRLSKWLNKRERRWVYVVIKKEQRNQRGWTLCLLCARLIEEEEDQEWSFLSLMVSPFQSFSFLFPLICKTKSHFLPLRLLLWCLNGKNMGICFLQSLLCPILNLQNYGSHPSLVGKNKLICHTLGNDEENRPSTTTGLMFNCKINAT